MRHIPTTLMQKVKKHLSDRKVQKFNKERFDEFQDEGLYTGAPGSADIHRLKSLDNTEKKLNAVKV